MTQSRLWASQSILVFSHVGNVHVQYLMLCSACITSSVDCFICSFIHIYQTHYNYRHMNTQDFVSKLFFFNQMSSKARILFKNDLRHIIEIRKVDVTK